MFCAKNKIIAYHFNGVHRPLRTADRSFSKEWKKNLGFFGERRLQLIIFHQDPAYQEYYEKYYAELEKHSSQGLPNKEESSKTSQDQKVTKNICWSSEKWVILFQPFFCQKVVQ